MKCEIDILSSSDIYMHHLSLQCHLVMAVLLFLSFIAYMRGCVFNMFSFFLSLCVSHMTLDLVKDQAWKLMVSGVLSLVPLVVITLT